jgi:MFS family permease
MQLPARPKFDRDFALLFMVMLVIGAGNTALQSVLPSLGRSIGVADFLIAGVFSVSAAVWVVSAPYWAARSDREGRRSMVLVGIGGFSVSILLVALVLSAGLAGWIVGSVTIVAVAIARVLYGTFGSAAPPAAQAMIALRTSREERTKALTMLGSAFGLGTIIGPALAPYLVLPGLGLAGPAYAFALIGSVTFVAVWRFLPADGPIGEGHGAQVSYPSIGGAPAGASITAAVEPITVTRLSSFDTRIRAWMAVGLVSGHAQAMTGAAMGFLVIDRLHLPVAEIATQQAIGLVLMTGAGAALLVQWGIIPLLAMTPRGMALVGLVVAGIGLIGTASANTLYSLATTYALSSVGFGFVRPAVTSGSSLAVGRALQGAVAGRVTANNGAAFIIGPALGVALYEGWHPLPYLVAAAMCLVALTYAWRAIARAE